MRPLRRMTITMASLLVAVMIGAEPVSAEPMSAGSGDRLWVARYDGGTNEAQAAGMAVSADGTVVYIAGSVRATAKGATDFATLAYSRGGVLRWVRTYDGPTHGYDRATAIASGPARVYVTGYSEGDRATATIAYASSGKRLWTRRHVGDADAIAAFGDGSVVVTGSGGTVAYDADGTRLWVQRDASGAYVGSAPDGSMAFVAEYDAPYAGGGDVLVRGIDATTGAIIWTTEQDWSWVDFGTLTGFGVSPDGTRVYVSFYWEGGNQSSASELYGYRTDDGALFTGREFGFTATHGLSISPSSDRVYLAGGSFVMALRANGELLWRTACDRSGSLTASSDGKMIYTVGGSPFTTNGLGSDGEPRWSRVYGTARGTSWGTAIVASPDGSVAFVTGAISTAQGEWDIATIAYRG